MTPSDVLSHPTLHVVYGPPGCGKSTHLATLAYEAAVDFGAGGVLICSFTRTAAQEIREKANRLLIDKGAQWRYPHECASTLHSHALRALSTTSTPKIAHAKEHLDDWNYTHPAWSLSPSSGRSDRTKRNPHHGDGLFESYSAARASGSPMPVKVKLFAERWQAWKDERGVLDFEDLIERAVHLPPPGDPKVLLVDEAQDCSPSEFRLLESWSRHAHIVYVGDPDQSIFGFRGIDPDALEQISKAPQVLSQSYRCPRAVHHLACELRNRYIQTRHAEWAPRDCGGSVQRVRATPDRVASIVERGLEEGQSVLLLAQCGYMLSPWRNALRERGVLFRGFQAPSPLLFRSFLRSETNEEAHRWIKVVDNEHLQRGTKTHFAKLPKKERFDRANLTAAFNQGRPAPTSIDELWDVMRTAERKRYAASYSAYQKGGVRAITEEPRAHVSTITSAKGMEADLVVLSNELSPAAAIFPDNDALGRLFYVGITRAREDLVLVESSGERAFKV